jgi:predicted TIM-barrel fold metal-dependent hydrolase
VLEPVRPGHADPPPDLLHRRDFVRGLRQLGARGLAFDTWTYHSQLHEVVTLAHRLPELTIIVDYLGGPLGVGSYRGRRHQARSDWRRGIAQLASCPNVVMKLGGIGMPFVDLTGTGENTR